MSVIVPAVVSSALLRKISVARPKTYTQLGSVDLKQHLMERLLPCRFGMQLGMGVRTSSQQLVGIARALIGKPRLILADEPTGNLNSKQGEEIMELFRQLNKEGVTIIQVTHSEKNAEYGSRIIHLLDGRIEKDGL